MSGSLCGSVVFSVSMLLFVNQLAWAQPSNPEEFVTYEKQSNFIKEFAVPFDELGIRGLAADSGGNVWFYHSTNRTSTLVSFDPDRNEFTKFPVEGKTVADNAIINLASAQLAFDDRRNAVWFTDARINAIGMLDIENGKISVWPVPSEKSGPMGIALSPDGNSVWFTEITGNNIGRFDIQSGTITEYPLEQNSGPALLTFDDRGQLWVSLSFAQSVLAVQPWAIDLGLSLGASALSLTEGDRFSPLGIAVSDDRLFLPDHGSSRVIVADANPNLKQYDVYWTSPSSVYPTTLPSQIVPDKLDNVYFAEHGGNRISKISSDGIMTEYDVPTGPLSTVVFLTVAPDGKVWFAEWASNKIAYLDASEALFGLAIQGKSMTIDESGHKTLNVTLTSPGALTSVSPLEIEVGLTGMSESGLIGVTYESNPPRVNLQDVESASSKIVLMAQDNARPGNYTAMVKISAQENDGLVVSKLYPIEIVLDMPEPMSDADSSLRGTSQAIDLNEMMRIAAVAGVVSLIAFIVYKRAKRSERS